MMTKKLKFMVNLIPMDDGTFMADIEDEDEDTLYSHVQASTALDALEALDWELTLREIEDEAEDTQPCPASE